MNIEDLQAVVAARISGVTGTGQVLFGAVVISEDGSYPQTPGREQALAAKGLLLLVWQVESEGLEEDLDDGSFRHSVSIHVVVEENQAVNRAAGGTGITAAKAVRLIMERVSGSGEGKPGRTAIGPMDPPFKNFGKVNGVNRWVVSFTKTILTKPAAG